MILSRTKKVKIFIRILLQIIIMASVIIYLFPILWSFVTSIKTGADTFIIPPKFIFTPTMEAYVYVIKELNILYYLANSLIITAAATVLATIIAMFAAYALARFKWKRKENFAFFLLTLKMLPPVAVIIPIYLIYRNVENLLGIPLIDTRGGLVFIYLFFNIPFSVWILRSFFEKIPKSIEEAALIDGCSKFGIIFRIILPISKPGIIATIFFNLIFTWNEFLYALILTDRNARTLAVEASKLIGFRGILWNQVGVYSVFCLVPIIIFMIYARNNLVSGLTLGSIGAE